MQQSECNSLFELFEDNPNDFKSRKNKGGSLFILEKYIQKKQKIQTESKCEIKSPKLQWSDYKYQIEIEKGSF